MKSDPIFQIPKWGWPIVFILTPAVFAGLGVWAGASLTVVLTIASAATVLVLVLFIVCTNLCAELDRDTNQEWTIDELKDEQHDIRKRARKRGEDWQRYLILINSGGLIAVLGLVGVLYNKNPSPPPPYGITFSAFFFLVGLIAALTSVIRSIWVQNIRRQSVNELINLKQSKEKEDQGKAEKMEKEFNKREMFVQRLVQTGFPIENVGFLLFIIGVIVGIVWLLDNWPQ